MVNFIIDDFFTFYNSICHRVHQPITDATAGVHHHGGVGRRQRHPQVGRVEQHLLLYSVHQQVHRHHEHGGVVGVAVGEPLLRQHQFEKGEMVTICTPETDFGSFTGIWLTEKM